MDTIVSKQFYQEIFEVLQEAKTYASKAINFASVLANWHTGRLIVEEEQKGMERAKYGKFLIKELSERLREDFGRGYDPTNLKLFRKFVTTQVNFFNHRVQNGVFTEFHRVFLH